MISAPNPSAAVTSLLATSKASAARASDGDYKTPGQGHMVRDADGDYKPTRRAMAGAVATTAGATMAAVLTLAKAG